MNTPAHVIIGTTLFGRRGTRWVPQMAALGGLTPDISLFVMATWAIYIEGIPAKFVFRELYFTPAWQNVFAVDNSFILWGALLACAVWYRLPRITAFSGAGFVHLCCDFPLHNEDARRQFWPVSDYVFRSPFSYYDPARYGNIIGLLEMALCAVLSIVLWRRFTSNSARFVIALGLAAEVLPGLMFRLMMHRH